MEALESIIKSIKRSPDANFLTTAGLITLIGFDAPPGGLLLTFLGVKQYISGFDGYKIASKYKITVAKLKKINNLKSDVIYPGDKLHY